MRDETYALARQDTLLACERAYAVLLNRAVAAAYQAGSPSEVLAVQRDMVTGALRLETRCRAVGAPARLLQAVVEYRRAAEQVLARLEGRRELPDERI
jgi:hypothetical protein